MVPFQHLAGSVHADPFFRIGVPGHFQAHIQVITDDGPLGTAERLLGELADFFQQMLLGVLVQLQRLDLLAVGVDLIVGILPLAQFVLEDADLRP